MNKSKKWTTKASTESNQEAKKEAEKILYKVKQQKKGFREVLVPHPEIRGTLIVKYVKL